MANNNINILTCTQPDFLKYLKESELKEPNFKDMFTKLNDAYINECKGIYNLNENRVNILEKIRSAQHEFKLLLGHGKIKPATDVNDDEENELDNSVVENKVDKRGKKKTETKESKQVLNEKSELEVDLENIPKMKTKVKETKQNIQSEEPEQEEPEEQAVKSTKKVEPSVKKTKSIKKVEPEPEPELAAEETEKVEQAEQESTKPTKKVQSVVKKNAKSVKAMEQEPEPEPEVEQEPEQEPVKVKKTATKVVKKKGTK